MARKTRQRISYVLPLAGATSGHRLGVNGLAVDQDRSILYTGGRDGVICAWDLQAGTETATNFKSSPSTISQTIHRQHVQAHTHWINDLALVQNGDALVSASSDVSVKVWRPHASDIRPPQTVGLHSDYVKCLASPSGASPWIAAAGLDRKISVWDLNGAGQRLQIQVPDDDAKEKGSVYALAATDSMLVSGGPENVVKVWDPRSAKRITHLVGHTDNIRDVLISEDGDTILSASSDQTIKVWSMAMGRCIYTMSMHTDSIWTLFSTHPHLATFYSGDRSGFVAKTDTRGAFDLDNGLSVAMFQEQEGINKVLAAGGHIWTATASSSVNRWADHDLAPGVQIPDTMRSYKFGAPSKTRFSISSQATATYVSQSSVSGERVPLNCVLRISNTASFPPSSFIDRDRTSVFTTTSPRKPSAPNGDSDLGTFNPLRDRPEETIEGRNGLIKHVMLNDRRRVLTLDSVGEVMMWDLLRCAPIRSFGKCDIDDVVPQVNTTETVANWCTVDTRTGTLTCVLEENHCFDAELYADELEEAANVEFKEDQRINLGKWVLRYLFADIIDEELRRDEKYRKDLISAIPTLPVQTNGKPAFISIPAANMNGWQSSAPTSATTPRAVGMKGRALLTPGLSIGAATPGMALTASPVLSAKPIPSPSDTGSHDLSRPTSSEKPRDYFSSRIPAVEEAEEGSESSEGKEPEAPTSPSDVKDNSTSFSKRLRASFTPKKMGKSTPAPETLKPAAITEEKSDDSDSKSSQADEKVFDDSFRGTLSRIRAEYTTQAANEDGSIMSLLAPSLPTDTPILRPPPTTTVLIQEDRPDSGGVADLFEGELSSLKDQVDLVEHVAPSWLAETLLQNRIPQKEIFKVTFTLEPADPSLPFVTADSGAERLNANRMLRARKILGYIGERLEPEATAAESIDLRPDEYLELQCQGQPVPPKMTLATIRTHIWRGGGDVVLQYRGNGKRALPRRLRESTPVDVGATSNAPATASAQ
ncbi:hypothetical protein FH972_022526 [Carpinus fangiana]|uniref:Uncharacterized protein n=1 Tax=Carpinus fangiana TaxID=176857 RepID=A0A5N6KSW4_9ROSI|nr:hypothetical protein FH972_022526 [Carpinus fangiana]